MHTVRPAYDWHQVVYAIDDMLMVMAENRSSSHPIRLSGCGAGSAMEWARCSVPSFVAYGSPSTRGSICRRPLRFWLSLIMTARLNNIDPKA